MQAGDWNITEIERKPHSDSRLENLSFTIHVGHATERLQDIPFPKGMQAFDLACWCAEGLRKNTPQEQSAQEIKHFATSPLRALQMNMEDRPQAQGSERTFG